MSSNIKQSNAFSSLIKAVLFCVVFTLLLVGVFFLKSMFPVLPERWAHGVLGTFAALLVTWLFLKFNKAGFASIGFTASLSTIKNFFTGLLAGILIMGALTIIVIYTSGFSIAINSKSNFLHFILLSSPLILLAYMEEVAFRGYPLQLLKQSFSLRSSLLITSLLFALYHIANGWSVQSSLLGPGPWGIIFGLAALYGNGISMATGLHYGVNLTTAAFAINDSAHNLWILKQGNGQSLEHYQSSTLETLLPQLAILIVAVILMEWYLRKRHRQ